VNKKTIRKLKRKKHALGFKKQGFSVKVIAKKIGVSKVTIYRYFQEEYDKKRYPELKDQIKKVLIQDDLGAFLETLSYKDICLLRRRFDLYGYDRDSKIRAITKYFKHFSILGVYPENLTRSGVKKAFYKKVKKVHPDINKKLSRDGREFQEVYQSYTHLLGLA